MIGLIYYSTLISTGRQAVRDVDVGADRILGIWRPWWKGVVAVAVVASGVSGRFFTTVIKMTIHCEKRKSWEAGRARGGGIPHLMSAAVRLFCLLTGIVCK